jgi:hypothetical protein
MTNSDRWAAAGMPEGERKLPRSSGSSETGGTLPGRAERLTMSDESDKLRRYADHYGSGLYTKPEAIWAMLGILKSSDFRTLWADVPDWAQSEIWMFLKPCDETTILYDFSSHTSGVIASSLIDLKNWLIKEKGYE